MSEPIARLVTWREEARTAGMSDPEAAALATASTDGVPSVRMVLWRGEDDDALWFFTNHRSRKAVELAANPRASLCFHYWSLERQVRVEGTVERLSDEASDAYFRTRPRESQLGAWASPQSEVISSLGVIYAEITALGAHYAGVDVPRPPFWGGYRLVASGFEFWQGRPGRLHDRERWTRGAAGWDVVRLAP